MQRLFLSLSRKFPGTRDTLLRTLSRANIAVLDYPVSLETRWGHGRADHPQLRTLLARNEQRYLGWIETFANHRERFFSIPVEESADPTQPHWANRMMSGLDAAAIYGFLAARDPERYVEVGSGNSTKFARRAINDLGLRTKIISIDPHPRAEIDTLCDEVIRQPLERMDLAFFSELEANDLVLIDNSHRLLQNSDVTVTFLDLIPNLPSGILIGIDDIFLPADYPPEWRYRYYSEQYALAAFLLGGHARYVVELPVAYLTRGAASTTVSELLHLPVSIEGNTFWMSRTP